MEEKIIDGVDVAGCVLLDEWKHCNICKELIKTIPDRHQCLTEQDLRCEYYSNCDYKQLKRLEQENEKIKKQYNCYACGNCKGTEDYINLEKHHKGLRKQFDILVKRNNELSLRIEQLEQENEKLKEEFASFMNGDYCAESCKKMNNAFQDAHKAILKENEKLKNILKDIDKKLELALDVEETNAEESFDLLYEIQEIITEAIGE